MSDAILAIVAYDVVQDERRQRVSSILAGYGARVQLSVFEVEGSRDCIDGLVTRLSGAIDPLEDQVRIWTTSASRAAKATVLGQRRLEERPDFLIV